MSEDFEGIIRAIGQGEPVPPFLAEIHITNICSHDCRWCIYRELRESERISMSSSQAEGLISELAGCGCEAVLFSGGGEPLMHPNAEGLIALAHERGMGVTLITNGSRLDKVDGEKLMKNLDCLRVSVDASSDESYAEVHRPKRGSMSYTELFECLARLQRGKPEESEIILSYILDKQSLEGVARFIDDCARAGIEKADIKTEHHLSYTERRDLVQRARELLGEANQVQIGFDTVKKRRAFVKKKWVSLCYRCVIEANGGLYPCCHTIEPQYLIGNVLSEGFEKVWRGERHREMIEEYYRAEKSCPTCSDSGDAREILRCVKMIYEG